jgi:heme-degrading monooxygenase HmoA
MYIRVLTFTGAKDIDGGVSYLRDVAMPILRSQVGYHGVSASADRSAGVFGILSLWESESARASSESALGKTRQEATEIVGGQLIVENFDEVASVVSRPPVPGCHLIVARVSMDPKSVDDNVKFFKTEAAPQISSQPGFCALRNMIDRKTGRGIVGTVWESHEALEAFATGLTERRQAAVARGVTFGETTYREVLLAELK